MAARRRRKRVILQVGDVFEVKTPWGYRYVQYMDAPTDFFNGTTLRVLPGVYEKPLSDEELRALAEKPGGWYGFTLVREMVREGVLKKRMHVPPPPGEQCPRRLRQRWSPWWTIEEPGGVRYRRAPEELTDEERRLPIAEINSPALFIEQLGPDYDPYEDVLTYEQLEEKAKAEGCGTDEEAEDDEEVKPGTVVFFLYFPNRRVGKRAAAELRARGLDVVDEESAAEDGQWCVMVRHPAEEFSEMRDELDEFARKHGGEYDGWELRVS